MSPSLSPKLAAKSDLRKSEAKSLAFLLVGTTSQMDPFYLVQLLPSP